MLGESALIAQAETGDREALGKLLEVYLPRLSAMVSKSSRF